MNRTSQNKLLNGPGYCQTPIEQVFAAIIYHERNSTQKT